MGKVVDGADRERDKLQALPTRELRKRCEQKGLPIHGYTEKDDCVTALLAAATLLSKSRRGGKKEQAKKGKAKDPKGPKPSEREPEATSCVALLRAVAVAEQQRDERMSGGSATSQPLESRRVAEAVPPPPPPPAPLATGPVPIDELD